MSLPVRRKRCSPLQVAFVAALEMPYRRLSLAFFSCIRRSQHLACDGPKRYCLCEAASIPLTYVPGYDALRALQQNSDFMPARPILGSVDAKTAWFILPACCVFIMEFGDQGVHSRT